MNNDRDFNKQNENSYTGDASYLVPQLIDALDEIGKAFGQANLLSSATDAERYEALSRLLNAWNSKAVPIFERLEADPLLDSIVPSQTTISGNVTLSEFENALIAADWNYEFSDNGDRLVNGHISIERAADYFAALAPYDREAGEELMKLHVPPEWLGWGKELKNAFGRKSNKAIETAIGIGTLSDDRRAQNYAGAYLYMHTTRGLDYFKHCKTKIYVMSPAVDRRALKAAARLTDYAAP